MRVSECIGCKDFPCSGVKHECCLIPGINIKPDAISIAMVSEAAPQNRDREYCATCLSAT